MAKKTNIRRRTAKEAACLPAAHEVRLVSRQAKGLPKITTREIIAAKLGCEPDELLAYVEKPNGVIIVIAPDGRKLKFTSQEL
jgi:predicted ester cyclase